MDIIVRSLAYLIFETSMLADQVGSGIGVLIFAIALFIFSGSLCLDGFKVSNKNVILILLLLAPFIFLFVALQISANAGIGNYILEVSALIMLMLIFCVIYKVGRTLKHKFFETPYSLPQLWLFIAVIIFRVFMPFIDK